jgi:outer membrane protein
LSQPIYHHDYWVQLDQSDNQIAQAEAEYVAEQQNLLLRTAKAYFGVLLAQNSLEYANAEQQTVERQVQEMQRRLTLGAASIDELQEAQSGYDQARAISIEAQRELQAAQTALTEIIGPADHELNSLRPDLKPLLPEPDQLEDWMNLARQNNLALIAAQHRAEVARKTIEIQFAGHLPTLDLVGNLATTDTDRTQGVEANSQTIGVQMNMPLYLGGSVDSKVRQAQHQFEAARKHIDKQRRAAERQAQDAFQGIVSTIDRIKALESAQRSTEITVEAFQKGLQVGNRSLSELLLVNRNLFRVRRDHAKAKYDYIVNCLTLKQAAGMLVRGDLELVNGWLVGR